MPDSEVRCLKVFCRLKETCLETWTTTALPAVSCMHAAKSFHASKTTARTAQILHEWRTYAAVRAFKHALTTHAIQHRMRCVAAHVWHVWQQQVRNKQRKRALGTRAALHSIHAVLCRAWLVWTQCVELGQSERSSLQVAIMHRHQVMALRGLKGFSECLRRRYSKRLAATHCKVTTQRCAACFSV